MFNIICFSKLLILCKILLSSTITPISHMLVLFVCCKVKTTILNTKYVLKNIFCFKKVYIIWDVNMTETIWWRLMKLNRLNVEQYKNYFSKFE